MFNSGCAKRFVFAVFAFVLSTLSREVYAWQVKGSGSHQFVIAIHGGGGVRAQEDMTSKSRMAHRKVLQMALEVGHEILFGGGTSVSAVEAAIPVPSFINDKVIAVTRAVNPIFTRLLPSNMVESRRPGSRNISSTRTAPCEPMLTK